MSQRICDPCVTFYGREPREHRQPQRGAGEFAALDERALAELIRDVCGDPCVGGGGRGEDGQCRVGEQERRDPLVVGPKVVPPR